MSKWYELELLIDKHKGDGPLRFRTNWVAQELKVDMPEASSYVQAYLTEQRYYHNDAEYVIHREGRTRNAVWVVGATEHDLAKMKQQLMSDTRRRVTRACYPDVNQLAKRNPSLRMACEAYRKNINMALEALAIACNGSIG